MPISIPTSIFHSDFHCAAATVCSRSHAQCEKAWLREATYNHYVHAVAVYGYLFMRMRAFDTAIRSGWADCMEASTNLTRDDLIMYYSLRGIPVAEMQSLLQRIHGYVIRFKRAVAFVRFVITFLSFSKRQLIRLWTRLGVSRSRCESPMSHISMAIQVVNIPRASVDVSFVCYFISEGNCYIWQLTRVPGCVE